MMMLRLRFSAFSTTFSLSWFWETLDAEQFSSNIERVGWKYDSVCVCVRVCVRASVVFQLALHTLIHSLTHTHTHWFEKFFISHHSDSILSCFLYAVTGRRMSVREERILLYACAVLRFLDEERQRERERNALSWLANSNTKYHIKDIVYNLLEICIS